MRQSRTPRGWLAAWFGVWGFWLFLTRDFHPTFVLAVVVTTSLVVAYASAAYLNYRILVPRLWSAGRRWAHAGWLAVSMSLLTALALAVIRLAYVTSWGPDPDPYGLYKHYCIDLFGMAVHVLAAAGVVAIVRRVGPARTSRIQ